MAVHQIKTQFGIEALNPGSFPLVVAEGSIVSITTIEINYQGPGGPLWLCWGLKAGTGNFNNGANLFGGTFASYPVNVLRAYPPNSIYQAIVVNARHIIPVGASGRTFDTYIWIAEVSTADETQILAIDTDAGVIQVL